MAAPWNPLMHEETYVRRRAVPNSHTSSVVFTHGVGQKSSEWLYVVDRLRALAPLDHVAFIFPYLNHDGTAASNVELVQTIVTDEIKKGIAHDRIAVVGFAKGGPVALSAVLSSSTKIAGVGSLALDAGASEAVTKPATEQSKTPVFIAARAPADSAVVALAEALKATGQPVQVAVYDTAVTATEKEPLTQQELEALAVFLSKVLPVAK
ncbi:Phospholipase/carboxylesterase/thioesterase [Niveomyces insectorum RCEF 264]|uniref:Phospholipase/carboxylesterase/thioesterase n=1 Tax=Niveomyces insectorum RCEF 264 TaxID=1081102 RepID=A0A167NFA4_9HYPO|nr:Phospholipase/carboxylesterase/thioesterase [Niveomyces insectorum RCEF 264]